MSTKKKKKILKEIILWKDSCENKITTMLKQSIGLKDS